MKTDYDDPYLLDFYNLSRGGGFFRFRTLRGTVAFFLMQFITSTGNVRIIIFDSNRENFATVEEDLKAAIINGHIYPAFWGSDGGD